MAAPVVEARALVRRFGSTPVLTGLDFRADAGEIVGIFGPNGAGKTTLVRVLATLLSPSAGAVCLFGADAFGRHASRLRRRLGLVSHETFLYSDLSGTENLAYYARLYGIRDGHTRADELLAWAGLAEHGARSVRSYSRGMAQRLAIARALIHRPELLLLDEPFSSLDAAGAESVERMLLDMHAEGRTVLLTTHDMERGLRVANRVYILNRGRVAWESRGPTEAHAFGDAYRRVVGGS